MVLLVKWENTITPMMKKVCLILDSQQMEYEYVSREDCELLTKEQSEPGEVYIFERFEGAAFKTIRALGNPIYGLACLIECDQMDLALPNTSPLLCLALHDKKVCITGGCGSEIREDLFDKICMMGGEARKDFNENVTHLIASEVGTKKYIVAAAKKTPIMDMKWIPSLWKDSHLAIVSSSDSLYEKMKCGPFLGLSITSSGLSVTEKNEVKEIVEMGGGRYNGTLKHAECTHLVINTPEGQKYEFAKRSKLEIVNMKWTRDCAKKGYNLAEHDYRVKPKEEGRPDGKPNSRTHMKTSTPHGSSRNQDTFENVSIIDMTHIDATIDSFGNDTSMFQQCDQTRTAAHDASLLASMQMIDTLDYKAKSSTFLDNCKIYISGFNSSRTSKLQKIISKAGGFRSANISEYLTHIIIGAKCKDLMLELKTLNKCPPVLKVLWLIHSYKNERIMPIENYLLVEQMPSPDNLKVTEAPKKKIKLPIAVQEPSTPPSFNDLQTVNTPTNQSDDHIDHVLSQYTQNSTYVNEITDLTDESGLLKAFAKDETTVKDMENTTIEDNSNESSDLPTILEGSQTARTCQTPFVERSMVQSQGRESEIFKTFTFVIIGFSGSDTKYFQEIIMSNAGKVLALRSRAIPTYCVVPLLLDASVKRTCDHLVTMTWLLQSVEEGVVCDIDDLEVYTPFVTAKLKARPLTGCVITISGFESEEKNALYLISTHLGAVEQDQFVKNNAPYKNLLKSTHLVIDKAAGIKYKASNKWNLPAVSKYWLFECLEKGEKVSENNHDIKEQLPQSVIKNSRIKALLKQEKQCTPNTPQMDTPSKFLGSKIFLPKYNVDEMLEALKTPVVEGVKKETPLSELFRRNFKIGFKLHVDPALLDTEEKKQLYTPPLDRTKQYSETPPTPKLKLQFSDKTTCASPIDTYGVKKLRAAQAKPLRKRFRLSEDCDVTEHSALDEESHVLHAPPSSNNEGMESQACEVTWNDHASSQLETLHARMAADLAKESAPYLDDDNDDDDEQQEVNYEEDMEEGDIEMSSRDDTPLLFQFSGIEEKTKDDLELIIKKLGGQISQENCFDLKCSHLLTEKPSKNEKYLACLASGKWILYTAYIKECEKQGKFIEPEHYEWGSEAATANLPTVSKNLRLLAAAAHRCRKTITDQKKENRLTQNFSKTGVFSDWKIVLMVESKKEAGFTRLLEAGGAQIMPFNENELSNITHAFIDRSSRNVDLETMKQRGILCLKPDYIVSALINSENSHETFIFNSRSSDSR